MNFLLAHGHFTPDDWPDAFRYFVAMCATFLIGINISIIVRVKTIFRRDWGRWIGFFAGKTILTAYCAADLIDHLQTPFVTWRTPVVLFGVLISTLSLIFIRKGGLE